MTQPPRFCPNCGAERRRPDAHFCHRCGQPLADAIVPPAPEPAQPTPAAPVSSPKTGRNRRAFWLGAAIVLLAIALTSLLVGLRPWQREPMQVNERPPTEIVENGGSSDTPMTNSSTDSSTPVDPAVQGPEATSVSVTATVPPPSITPAPLPTATPTSLPPTEPPPPTATPPPTDTPTPPPNPTPTPLPVRRIAYVSEEGGSPQIWLVDADGANRRRLTSTGANSAPSWSLDNKYIYYVKESGAARLITRFDLNTNSEEIVARDGGNSRVRFLSSGQTVMVKQAGGQHQLVVGNQPVFTLDRPFDFNVSPDQTLILIDPLADPRLLFTVGINGGPTREVAGAKSWNGSWSPDGRLLYVSDRAGVAFLYAAARDGGGAAIIGPTNKWNQAPAWSPDGRWIGYVSGDGPAWNLYRINAAGSGVQRMALSVNPGKGPVWEPDSWRMAFESNRYGDWDIFTVDRNGQEHQLTTSNANDYDPAWSH